MATLTSNISSFSLSVSGNTQQSSTISWILPSVPSDMSINSCILSGTATASMTKGSATIKVNGTTVSSGSKFSINLGTSNTTSSVSATTVGNNKNAKGTVNFTDLVYTVTYTEPVQTYTVKFIDYDGTVLKTEIVEEGGSATAPADPSRIGYTFVGWDASFSNVTSDLTVTAQYYIPSVLKVKENGNWISIQKIFKKIAGKWVEQKYANCEDLFSTNVYYMFGTINPVAILYSDGTLVFQDGDYVDSQRGEVINTYTDWEIVEDYTSAFWYSDRSSILKVCFDCLSKPIVTKYWFYKCQNLTNIDVRNFDTSKTTDMSRMFGNCTNLTSLDISDFNTSNVTNMSSMFNSCTNLTNIDLSSFNTSNVTNMNSMFNGCTNPNLTIYVKDEATKTKIEASTGFPTTATVVIGKPN